MKNTVAIFTALYPPALKGGGPIRSTEVLAETAPAAVKVIVLTGDRDLGDQEPLNVPLNRWIQKGKACVRYTSNKSPIQLFRGYSAVRREHPNILNFNSFFSTKYTIIPLLLSLVGFWGRPRILLAPRGEFGIGALNRRSLKKRMYIWLFRLLGLNRSVIWHSTADHESNDIRQIWGADSRIILRGEDTLLPLEPRNSMLENNHLPRFVFLGRIVEHKGLAIILHALTGTTNRLAFDIYGPEEDPSYAARCRNLVRALPSNITVDFKGPASPDQVPGILASYDALLMPTAGENFSHVIAESLSVSCPVFATPYTPWTQTLKSGGGIVVQDREPESWLATIDGFLGLSGESRMKLRKDAGDSYRMWRGQPVKSHVWSLTLELEE